MLVTANATLPRARVRGIAQAAICLLIIAGISSCDSEGKLNSSADTVSTAPDQVGFDATLTVTNTGEPIYRIRYKRMEKYSNRREVKFMDGVVMEFFDKGQPSSRVLSKEARLNESTNDIEFSGNVRSHSEGGIQLYTERLAWHDSRGQLTSDVYVTVITADKDTINGTGFESEKSFKAWSVREPSGVSQKNLKTSEPGRK